MGLRKLVSAVAASATALVAACGQMPTVSTLFHKGPVVRSVFVAASKNGPVLSEILGDPFGYDSEAFAEAVRAIMGEAITDRVTQFTGDASAAPSPNIRVVMLFGATPGQSARQLCLGNYPAPQPVAEGEELRVRAVFCADGDLLTDVGGRVKRGADPDDKNFRKLVWLMARALVEDRRE